MNPDGGGGTSLFWRTLARLVGPRNADEVVGDLAEGFRRRRVRSGPVPAGLWLARQVAGLAFWLSWDRLLDVLQPKGTRTMAPRERVARRTFRQALRTFLRTPGFSALSVLTLAIGVGAATAIYSVVDGVLLESLPYPESEDLAYIWHTAPKVNLDEVGTATGLHLVYGEGSRLISDMATYRPTAVNITGQGDATRVQALQTTASLFSVLQVSPAMGRGFTQEEAAPGGPAVVMVSHGFWSEYLGGDADALGRSLVVNDRPHEVVGVMPPGFAFPRTPAQVMTPLRIDPAEAGFGGFNTESVARLAAGATMEGLEAELNGLLPRVAERFEDIDLLTLETTGVMARAQPLKDVLVGPVRTTLMVLLGTVALLLLIACANIGNLFIARAEGRRSEVAVRRALGANGGDLLRQYGAESGLLAVVSAAGGLGLAFLGVRVLLANAPAGLPRLDNVGVDGSVALFAIGISTLAAFLFGTVPMIRHARLQPSGVLRDGARGSSAGRHRARGRRALVALQIAFGLVLLSASGLMLRSFRQVLNVELGFTPTSVLTFRLSLPTSRYATVESVGAFHQRALDELEALPGVTSAGVASRLPLSQDWSGDPLNREDAPLAPGEIPPVVALAAADPGYFETLEIPLIRGRLLDRQDIDDRTPTAVISRSVAEAFWPGEDPIGRRIMQGLPGSGEWSTVVGIVGDTPGRSLTEPPERVVYYSLAPPAGSNATWASRAVTYVVRSDLPTENLLPAIRGAIRGLDPDLPMASVVTMEDHVAQARTQMSFALVLLSVTAGMGVLLGGIGTYGVMAYVTGTRTRELGLRLALGAERGAVRRMVLKEAASVTTVGVLLGLAGAFVLTRFLRSLLYEVSATDPATFGIVTAVVFLVSILASDLPARRAADIPPQEALRSD